MTKIAILNNKKCQLITKDIQLFNKIKDFLSFKQEGAEHTEAYKNGYWDGTTNLMNKKGEFPSGLLKMAQNQIITLGQEVIVEDRRTPIKDALELNITQRLIDINKTPRDHQSRILEVAIKEQKGVIRCATGGGKTLITALITAKLNKPTIIYVIGIDLLQQFHDLFSSIFDEEIGFIGAGHCEIKRINIASVWTIGRALNLKDKDMAIEEYETKDEEYNESNKNKIVEMLKTTKVHMFDECHTITCATIKSIYSIIDPEHIYGLSGTPFRENGDDLMAMGMLGEQIINVSASELIERGLLVQPIIKFVSIPKITLKENYNFIYKNYIVENPERNSIILNEVKSLIEKKYKILVLFKQINHGKILHKLFELNEINCEMLSGNDSLERRNEVKKMLADGKIDVILASVIFDTGVDLPILNALVLASGGKSSIRTLQRVGRVIRIHPQKKFVAVVDFLDQTKYLKLHSLARYKTYLSENGFKVYKCKEMR